MEVQAVMEIQTRSEETGIRLFDSFEEAFNYAETDGTVWKISWNDIPDTKRVRMVRHDDGGWNYEPIT